MHKIKYLRIIVTDKCNLKCFFCHKEGIESKKHEIVMDVTDLENCLKVLCNAGIKKIKFMGGEPTLYKKLPEVISWLKTKDDTLDISMISNGVVKTEILNEFIDAGLDRVNISLHGYEINTFKEVTGGSDAQMDQCMKNIRFLKQNGKLGKINYVLLKEVNEKEFEQVLEFVHQENVILDVLNYIGNDEKKIARYGYSFDEIRNIIASKYRIDKSLDHENKYSINSQHLVLLGGGVINLKINQLNSVHFLKSCECCEERKFCTEGISAVRLTDEGVIRPCLLRKDLTYDLLTELKKKTYTEVVHCVEEYFENL